MRTALTILAGLIVGVLVALGVLAAFVFVGPDPVGLRPTPAPTMAPPSIAPSIAPSPSPSAAPSPLPSASVGSSDGPARGTPAAPVGSPSGSVDPGIAFHIGPPAPALVVHEVDGRPIDPGMIDGGTIDFARLQGKAVWLNYRQATCAGCIDEFPPVDGFSAR